MAKKANGAKTEADAAIDKLYDDAGKIYEAAFDKVEYGEAMNLEPSIIHGDGLFTRKIKADKSYEGVAITLKFKEKLSDEEKQTLRDYHTQLFADRGITPAAVKELVPGHNDKAFWLTYKFARDQYPKLDALMKTWFEPVKPAPKAAPARPAARKKTRPGAKSRRDNG